MQIQKIKIERFKSFYEPYELDFEQVKGLWKIAGSVGSGKTTIGEAILFGLFGSITGKNNGDLVSWGQKSGTVELWCKSNSRNIYIKRDVFAAGYSTIYVEIDGEELIFTNKRDAQQQLENEHYDISKVTMELLCIISFNNFKSLATLNTADTKKFLDQVLGFYTLTEYADACKQLRQENDSQLNAIERNISQLEAQINKLSEMSNLEIIEGDINELNESIKILQDQLDEKNLEYIDENRRLIKIDTDLKAEATRVKTLGAAKKKEIEFIERGVCPTCGAPIDQSQLETKKAEKEILLNNYYDIDNKIKSNASDITKNTSTYNESIRPIRLEIDKYKEKIVRLKEQAKRKNVNQEEIDRLQSEKNNWKSQSDVCEADSMSWERLCNILSNDVRSRILESFIPALNKNIMKYATELHQP